MCLEAVFFWPVFLCLFWAMFLCPVRACFLACAPSGFFWAFFCASFFEGNKSSWGVSPPPPPSVLCFAGKGPGHTDGTWRGVGTRTEHGAWAQWPPGGPPQQRPSTPAFEPVPGGCCGIKINGNVMQSLIRGRLTNSAGEPAAASDGPFLRIRSGAGISGAESVLCCVAPPVKEGACNCQAELNALQ